VLAQTKPWPTATCPWQPDSHHGVSNNRAAVQRGESRAAAGLPKPCGSPRRGTAPCRSPRGSPRPGRRRSRRRSAPAGAPGCRPRGCAGGRSSSGRPAKPGKPGRDRRHAARRADTKSRAASAQTVPLMSSTSARAKGACSPAAGSSPAAARCPWSRRPACSSAARSRRRASLFALCAFFLLDMGTSFSGSQPFEGVQRNRAPPQGKRWSARLSRIAPTPSSSRASR